MTFSKCITPVRASYGHALFYVYLVPTYSLHVIPTVSLPRHSRMPSSTSFRHALFHVIPACPLPGHSGMPSFTSFRHALLHVIPARPPPRHSGMPSSTSFRHALFHVIPACTPSRHSRTPSSTSFPHALLHVIPACFQPESSPVILSYKSSHLGFVRSINCNFHLRFHSFSRFSR